jgi:hypothetical protein
MKRITNKYMTLLLGLFASFYGVAQETTFTYTGAMDTYVVPPGVTSVQVECWGAQGGGSKPCSGPNEDDGGLGGYAVGNLSVTPGETIYIFVGEKPIVLEGGGVGPGGFNGGGDCGQWAGGGGGASDVRQGGTTLSDRVIVAGGGGGGNAGCPDHGAGGDGGGLVGIDGTIGTGWVAGTGGTDVAGGIGGGSGSDGGFGFGGTGAYHVAGGGGGWYGGGGAYAAGAGGGSSYLGGVTEGITTPGLRTGHGEIKITVLCTPLTVTATATEICFGDEITLDAESEGLGAITWSDGVVDGEPFTPAETGVITYTASSDDEGDCELSIDITVYEAPVVLAGAGDENFCEDEEIVLSAGGSADTWSWEPTDLTPGIGEHTYVLTGANEFGCEATDEVMITVHENPAVTATVDYSEICEGNEITLTGGGADDYEWLPGGVVDGEAFIPGPVGSYTYSVVGTDENDCQNTATVDVTVVEGITITYTTTDEIGGGDGGIDITVTGGVPPYTFDWDNDGTGDFDDDEDLMGVGSGGYEVVVAGSTGCESSASIQVGSQLNIENADIFNLEIYPNPTNGFITIQTQGAFLYELIDLNGKVVSTGNGNDSENLSLENKESGIYFVRIYHENDSKTIKVIKQ